MLLSTKEAAKMLHVAPCTVARWVKRGALEAIIIPNQGRGKRPTYRFKADNILAILGEGKQNNECIF